MVVDLDGDVTDRPGRYGPLPDEALERPDAMRPWARQALGAAMRAAAAKRKPRAKKATKR